MIQEYSIGRDENCQIRLHDSDKRISRHHATLKLLDNGKIFITDHSRNGTWVNGIRISPNVDYPLKRGDNVSFSHSAELNWALIPKRMNKMLIYMLAGAATIIVLGIAGWLMFRNSPTPVRHDAPAVQPTDRSQEQPADNQPESNAGEPTDNKEADIEKDNEKDREKEKEKERDSRSRNRPATPNPPAKAPEKPDPKPDPVVEQGNETTKKDTIFIF